MATTNNITKTKNGDKMLQAILGELRLLRKEVMFLLSQEDLEDYEHAERIKKSYRKAIKKYPPAPLWK